AAPIGANAVGALSANGGRLHRRVEVGGAPGAIAADDAEVWVVNTADDTVSRIDARKASAPANTISVGHDPTAVAIGAGSVWVTNGSDRSVSRINPGAAPSVGDTIAVGNAPSSVTVGLGAVWVTNAIDGTMTEIDPGRAARPPDHVRATIGVGAQPSAVTTGFGSVWVANAGSSNVFRIDPRTRSVVASISVGNGPQAITADLGGIWVANTLDNTASRIDPRSNSVVATVLVGHKPSGTTSTGPDVWVTNSDSDTITQIDAKTNEIVRTVRVGNAPQAAASGADVWVSARGSAALHRGGTLRIVASDQNVNSLDPAIAYRQFAFGVLATTNDGLVTFKRTAGPAGAAIVPDLATQLPAPSDSGRTYTFQLRKGIRYSTGEPVLASDFPASLERAFRLKNLPPYYDAIDGGAACAKRPLRCDLSRGIETDDRTGGIAIHLTHADPELLYKLALPFAALLPKGTPARDLGVGPHAGTGPYVITRGTPKQVVLTRNPQFAQWSSTAQPDGYPDRIEISLSASAKRDPTLADVAAVARGRFDYTPDAMPSDLLDRLVRTQTGQLHPYTQNTLRYEFLNTNIPPLDDARVRRAINLAVDRRAAVAALGGPLLATPTCQQVPPSLFGYRPYCPYTATPDAGGRWTAPDLAAARTMVRRAYTPGTRVEIVSIPDDRPVAGVVARAMQAIGLHPRLKILRTDDQGYFAYVSNPHNRAQAGLDGWSVDYPEPSNLLSQLLRCNAIAQTQSLNQAEFCDPSIDRRMDAALRLQTSDPAAAGALWAEIDRTITDAAPWVPLAVDRQYDVVSRRIGNYEHHPQFGVLIGQAWVR
ncbi:MAG: hypothetical protein QOE62_933, partial [Actinomycetota bacterium]|nr:hypothetical protein [Actinomycetota bacterium]